MKKCILFLIAITVGATAFSQQNLEPDTKKPLLDTKKLAFWKRNEDKTLAMDNAPVATGNAKDLARITNNPFVEYYPQVSSDGKYIMFYTCDNTKKGNEKFGIVYLTVGQPGRTPLLGSFTSEASWLPNSKEFVYCYLRPAKPVICKGSIDGRSGIAYVTPSAMGDADANPHVSPDGKKILFCSKIGNSYQMCLMDINGTNFSVLTEGYYACWHPSGKSFIYTKRVGVFEQIFSYDITTGQSTQLTSGEYSNFNGAYSVDGKHIVFCSAAGGTTAHVFVMKADGNSVVQLTQGNTTEWYPAFAPDGTIYFCSNAGAPLGQTKISEYADIWSIKFEGN